MGFYRDDGIVLRTDQPGEAPPRRQRAHPPPTARFGGELALVRYAAHASFNGDQRSATASRIHVRSRGQKALQGQLERVRAAARAATATMKGLPMNSAMAIVSAALVMLLGGPSAGYSPTTSGSFTKPPRCEDLHVAVRW
jgi:hypothetical protein